MKLFATTILSALSLLTTSSLAQEDHLCAPMVFSARFDDLVAPSLALLQTQCYNLCASARNSAINHFGTCFWQNVANVEVQSAHLVRSARCSDRCTEATVWSGDCGCTLDAKDIYVANDVEMFPDCEATKLVLKCFDRPGWTQRYGNESPARPCPGTSVISQKKVGGKGKVTGKETGKVTGKVTGKETSKETGEVTGKETSKETGEVTGKETSKETGEETDKDAQKVQKMVVS